MNYDEDLNFEALLIEKMKREYDTKIQQVETKNKYRRNKAYDESRFKWIKPYAQLQDNKRKVILSHYSIMRH